MKIIEKIKKFINGFRKLPVNMDKTLATKDTCSYTISESSRLKLNDEIKKILNLHAFDNISYGVKSFTCERVTYSDYNYKLDAINRPMYFIKHVNKEFNFNHLIENDVLCTVISRALDGKCYKFEIQTYFTYTSSIHEFDDLISQICAMIADTFVSDNNINKIIDDDFKINFTENDERSKYLLNRRYFTGYVKTYTDFADYHEVDVNKILDPIDYEPFEESVIEDSLNEPIDFNEFLEKETLFVDVVRKYSKPKANTYEWS